MLLANCLIKECTALDVGPALCLSQVTTRLTNDDIITSVALKKVELTGIFSTNLEKCKRKLLIFYFRHWVI